MQIPDSLRRLAVRARLWCSPVPGWKDRWQEYTRGRVTWPVPELPDHPDIIPFPAQWCIYTTQDGKLVFTDPAISQISGRLAEGEDAVRCARCGVHLHRLETGIPMKTNHSVPVCPWCVAFSLLVR